MPSTANFNYSSEQEFTHCQETRRFTAATPKAHIFTLSSVGSNHSQASNPSLLDSF